MLVIQPWVQQHQNRHLADTRPSRNAGRKLAKAGYYVMQPKTVIFIHIALLPVYLTVAVYLNLIPPTVVSNLSSLLRLAKTNLLKQRLAASLSSALHSSEPSSQAENMSTLQFSLRPSQERGKADHGWLKTFHTFSFAMYQDHKHELWGPLRVINEDRVLPGTGFGTHSHREFEIFSYVVSGELEHKDSMGNVEVLKRGDIQLTSAGTGISHSEKTYGSRPVHFLQIWSLPHTSRLTPKYYTRTFFDAEKTNKWVRVVAPAGSEGVSDDREAPGPAPVRSALTLYATLAEKGQKVEQPLKGKKGYVHVVQTSGYNPGKATGAAVRIGATGSPAELELEEGDGAYIAMGNGGSTFVLENIGDKTAEVLLFDLE
ncbi:putative pirin family protein [Lyophyllum shimeji]|uniref:Pirin family protein n=1 Tax=Lyophyllum shimeji TaxID=47721 RepID=A0A9P3PXC1_LYOSH|nr:putative pirin family protein [Lyophyllum shimeji]